MKDIAKEADTVIMALRNEKDQKGRTPKQVTTTQLRKFLTAVISVTNKVSIYKLKHPGITTLSDELAGEVKFLKVKAAYQAGRETAVYNFVTRARIFDRIDDIGNSIAKYEDFSRYIEALVAYHKYHGGN